MSPMSFPTDLHAVRRTKLGMKVFQNSQVGDLPACWPILGSWAIFGDCQSTLIYKLPLLTKGAYPPMLFGDMLLT